MKKKWLSWLLTAVLALVVVMGILWLRYGNKLFYKNVFMDPTTHVSFVYPDHWTIATGATNPYLIATVMSPEINEYTPSFNVTREDVAADMSLDQYVGQTMKQLRDVIGDFHQGGSSTINIDGHPARKVVFSGRYLNEEFSWEQVYTMKDNAIFVMTYLAPSNSFTGEHNDIQASFTTFAFN